MPSQTEFVEKYFEFNSDELKLITPNPRLKLGVEARLRRTYPSLVRDIHLSALFAEKGFKASYDRDMDVQAGIDHVFNYRGRMFNVHGYVGTRRGRLGRSIKNTRHDFKGTHLDIVLNLDAPETKKVGDFFLYSEKEINCLIKEMDEEIGTKI